MQTSCMLKKLVWHECFIYLNTYQSSSCIYVFFIRLWQHVYYESPRIVQEVFQLFVCALIQMFLSYLFPPPPLRVKGIDDPAIVWVHQISFSCLYKLLLSKESTFLEVFTINDIGIRRNNNCVHNYMYIHVYE